MNAESAKSAEMGRGRPEELLCSLPSTAGLLCALPAPPICPNSARVLQLALCTLYTQPLALSASV